MGSQSHKDLVVWQKGIQLCVLVYKICERFPKTELYGLTDQMKRAAVSVLSNIAEGQGRQHIKEFLRFLYIANGSLAELDTQRNIAKELSFLSDEDNDKSETSISEIRRMLHALINSLKSKVEN